MKQEAELLCEMSRTCFEELEQELILLYKTDARFGTRKNLLRIGEANGFMSVCCLLRPDWIGCSEEELLRLPEKLVYKFSYQGGLEAVAEALLQCRLNDDVIHDAMSKSNNVEGLFYSRLSPSTANWLQVPGPVGYKKINEEGDVGHLMIEHVEGTSFECHEHCTVTEVEQIIDAVARLQTFSHAEQLHELEEFSWNPWKTIGTCVVTKTVAHKILSETPAFYGAEFEPLTSKLMLALDDLYDLDTPMKELKVSPRGFARRRHRLHALLCPHWRGSTPPLAVPHQIPLRVDRTRDGPCQAGIHCSRPACIVHPTIPTARIDCPAAILRHFQMFPSRYERGGTSEINGENGAKAVPASGRRGGLTRVIS